MVIQLVSSKHSENKTFTNNWLRKKKKNTSCTVYQILVFIIFLLITILILK